MAPGKANIGSSWTLRDAGIVQRAQDGEVLRLTYSGGLQHNRKQSSWNGSNFSNGSNNVCSRRTTENKATSDAITCW